MDEMNLTTAEDARQLKCPEEKKVAIRKVLGNIYDFLFSDDLTKSFFVSTMMVCMA